MIYTLIQLICPGIIITARVIQNQNVLPKNCSRERAKAAMELKIRLRKVIDKPKSKLLNSQRRKCTSLMSLLNRLVMFNQVHGWGISLGGYCKTVSAVLKAESEAKTKGARAMNANTRRIA